MGYPARGTQAPGSQIRCQRSSAPQKVHPDWPVPSPGQVGCVGAGFGTLFPKMPLPKYIETTAVSTEAVLLGAGPQHRLVGRKQISWTSLQAEAFVLFQPGSGLRQVIMHLAHQAGFLPQVIFESGDMSMIRALVSEGMGIAAFPQSVIDAAGRSLVPLDLSPALPPRTVQLAWHQQRASTPTIQAFLDFVQEDLALHPWIGRSIPSDNLCP